MAVPTLRAAGAAASSTTSPVSPVIPSSAVVGDFLLCFGALNSDTMTTPTGWTALPNFPAVQGSLNLYGWYRVAVAGDPGATVNITRTTGAGQAGRAVIMAYSGVSTGSAPNASAAQGDANSDSTTRFPAITTTVPNCLIVYAVGVGTAAVTFTPPSGATEDFDGSGIEVSEVAAVSSGTVAATTGSYSGSNIKGSGSIALPGLSAGAWRPAIASQAVSRAASF